MTQDEFDQEIAELKSYKDDTEFYDEKEAERRARADAQRDNRK